MNFLRFRTSCNFILVLFHVTDIVCFYVKPVFISQNIKNKQTKQIIEIFLKIRKLKKKKMLKIEIKICQMKIENKQKKKRIHKKLLI